MSCVCFISLYLLVENNRQETSTRMLCGTCNERQQSLLESGDGSQIICGHLIIDEEEQQQASSIMKTDAIRNVPPNVVIPVPQDVDNKRRKKRRFATSKDLFKQASEHIKRKIKPIQKWTSLAEGESFLMKRVIEIEVHVETGPQIGYYAELEDENEETINVWISNIIQSESKKYTLTDNDVYIIPLGKAVSKEKNREYNDFVILKDNEMLQ